MEKPKFICKYCKANFHKLLSNIRYDGDVWVSMIKRPYITIPLSEEMTLCCGCGKSYDFKDLKDYNINLKIKKRERKLNKLL